MLLKGKCAKGRYERGNCKNGRCGEVNVMQSAFDRIFFASLLFC